MPSFLSNNAFNFIVGANGIRPYPNEKVQFHRELVLFLNLVLVFATVSQSAIEIAA